MMRDSISHQDCERSATIYDGFPIMDTSFHGLTPVPLCSNPLRGPEDEASKHIDIDDQGVMTLDLNKAVRVTRGAR
jgi:hypothetical protein